MATPANKLFQHTFDGAGYPSFNVVWPDFSFPFSGSPVLVNTNAFTKPVVDGDGHGIPSRGIGGVTWRGKSGYGVSLSALQADLWAKWSNAGFAGRREVGLIARYAGPQDVLVARVRSMGTSNPELRLFKVVGGVETQLGATYTGAGLSATTMNAGLAWRVRVEDLKDASSNTKVTVYLAPQGASGKGTQVLEWIGDLGVLRGALPLGVELRDQVYGTDVRVDNLTAWDLADEWNPSGPPPSPGTGWQVTIGQKLYTLRELAELNPPVFLVSCQQGYGAKGNALRLRVAGDYRENVLLFPGQYVEAYHDGAMRFRGWVADGELVASPAESQAWNAWDGLWASRQVFLLTDRKTPQHFFNVRDKRSDEYDPDLQGKTLGQVGRWLFDRYEAQLRAVGAAPPSSKPYVTAEWDALDAVIPDLALGGTFPAAIDSLLRFVAHRRQLFFDCADQVWHLRDVTALTDEAVSCTVEHLTLRVQPDRDKSTTYVEWIGTAQEEDTKLKLSTRDGSLRPTWTQEQEGKYGKDKRNKTSVISHALNLGKEVHNGIMRIYVDVAAGLLDTDDFRGAVATVEGESLAPLFVINNSATRIWMDPADWSGGTPPPPGSMVFLNLLDPEALAELAAASVGRSYFFGPVQICGYGNPGVALGGGKGLKLGGFCGEARASTTGEDGAETWSERYAFNVRIPTPYQQSMGFCDMTVTLAEKPKPPIALINYFPPKGGSPPSGPCKPGIQQTEPAVHVDIELPAVKAEAPYFREPAAGYRGTAYSEDAAKWNGGGGPAGTDWGCVQGYQIQDPDFVSMDQEPGLRKAAADILAVKGQKAYLATVELATPWKPLPGVPLVAGLTSRWAGLSKRINLTSGKRLTGWDTSSNLAVFRVVWDVEGGRTILEVGTASGWLNVNGVDVAAAYHAQRVLKQMRTELKRTVEAVNAMVAKNLERVGKSQGGPIGGCEVEVVNQQVKRVVNVEEDDEDKVRGITHLAQRLNVLESLVIGPEDEHPGSPVAVPGLDGAASQLPRPGGASPVLGSPASYKVPFQGPTTDPNAGRGRYGGLTGTEEPDAYAAPTVLDRRAGLAFRKGADATGNRDGGKGTEYSPTDSKGAPTVWTPYSGPLSLPGGRAPLKMLRGNSLGAQLLAQAEELAAGLGRVQDQVTREILQPGQPHASYPGGVPPGLLEALKAPGLLGPYELVQASVKDPGGPVWEGPKNQDGVNAGTFWRVAVPENILLRVVNVGWGAGLNGGAWAWWNLGPGGALEFLSWGTIVHKQAHYGDLEIDGRLPGVPSQLASDPTSPWGPGTGKVWQLNGMLTSGLVSEIPSPDYARGTPVFRAVLKESPTVLLPPGLDYWVRIDHSYQASPPSPPAIGTPGKGPTTDGTSTGTGQFKAPGGAIPPGLRVPSDSVVNQPGGGPNPVPPGPNNGPVLKGAGYEIATVQGGYLVRLSDATGKVAESWRLNHQALLEKGAAVDAWAVQLGKVLAENPKGVDSWNPQLNPPVLVFDDGKGADLWAVLIL